MFKVQCVHVGNYLKPITALLAHTHKEAFLLTHHNGGHFCYLLIQHQSVYFSEISQKVVEKKYNQMEQTNQNNFHQVKSSLF